MTSRAKPTVIGDQLCFAIKPRLKLPALVLTTFILGLVLNHIPDRLAAPLMPGAMFDGPLFLFIALSFAMILSIAWQLAGSEHLVFGPKLLEHRLAIARRGPAGRGRSAEHLPRVTSTSKPIF